MNKPIKILIATPLYPPDIGGPATYSKTLFDQLPNYGFDVEILSFGKVRQLTKWVRHLYYLILCIKSGIRSDIIYAQDPLSVGVPAAIASFVLRKPLILKIVGDYAWEQAVQQYNIPELLDDFLVKKYDFGIEKFRFLEKFTAKRAKCIIVPSNYLKAVVERWGIDSKKIQVIYNDVSLPKTQLSYTDERKKLNFADNDLILVSSGRLVPWKGFYMLIASMKKIISQYGNARLFIIGDGPQYSYLRDSIYSLGLENNIFLLGKLSHDAVLKYLAVADIFVFNTGYEGFSHQLLEAFAMGAPTITTNAGGNKEIVNENSNAIVVEFNDQKAWENAILSLCADSTLRQNIGSMARLSAVPFQQNTMVAKTANLLKSL